ASAQPAVPLITHNPYFSVWSMSDRLNEDWPRHWTGGVMGMSGMIRVDGRASRWCGMLPHGIAVATQIDRSVSPASTRYRFEADGVRLTVTFASPLEPGRALADLSRSVSIVRMDAESIDGAEHRVELYLDLSGEWCTHSPHELVDWSRLQSTDLAIVSMASASQPVLKNAGDHRRIDWGRVFLAGDRSSRAWHDGAAAVAIAASERSRAWFVRHGVVPEQDDSRMPRAANDEWPVLALSVALAPVRPQAPQHAIALVGYDEGRAIEYLERPLRPLWNAGGRTDFLENLSLAQRDAEHREKTLLSETAFVDRATRVGGPEYATLVALAYRQVLAGHAIVADWDGTPLMFSKENTSNGCIGTVDVIYPAAPFYLFHDPEMLKASLRPLLEYASSPRWTFPFAPHDLGTYPKANGQVYGGGERSEENQMPVEECGNMLIMLAALAKVEGNADFSKPHLPLLERWARYLEQHGIDPANQLCTDDFSGHLARNANLSAKSCIALAAYAQLLEAAGESEKSSHWRRVAEVSAAKWQVLAGGEHATLLAFGDSRNSWSQKYNLIWDRVLGLGLLPESLAQREVSWYRTKLGRYGLPLDHRAGFTKLDWSVWSACLTGKREDFDAIMAPTWAWLNASPPPSRVPLSDWYETGDGKTRGMHTRTVVGGAWMPLLMDKLGVGLR
ncbi:MAG: DUF4965 domain-containing protein, partial [Phycisphaerae bacterium]|nr:DUF4965 domain-containing protein [Phycisphaerae bacterium]